MITQTINFYNSRYGQPRYIYQNTENEFIIFGESQYIRIGGNDIIEYIDYEGGPFIGIGDNLKEWIGEDKEIIEIQPYVKMDLDNSKNYYKLIIK